MATLTFTHTDSITVRGDCDRQWVVPVSGNAGNATVRLPLSSDALDHRYLNLDGGSLVTVADEHGSGTWRGVISRVDISDAGVSLPARQVQAILGRRHVSLSTALSTVCPAMVVDAALRNAGEVLGLHVVNSPWDADAPVMDAFSFNGQDTWAVVSSAMDQSEGELHVNSETGGLYWAGPLAYARAYPHLLIAGANLRQWSKSADASDRVAEVTATVDGEPFTVTDGSVAAAGHWPAQAVISADSRRAAPYLAAVELDARRTSATTITGTLPVDHWDIRERDIVRVLIPRRAGIPAAVHTCRVVGRQLREGSLLMQLTLLIADAVPSRPRLRPARRSMARGRGAGTLGLRILELSRERGAA